MNNKKRPSDEGRLMVVSILQDDMQIIILDISDIEAITKI